MGVVTPNAGLPLWSDYPQFVRRHRILVGALVGLGLLGGLAWSLWLQPTTYSATASVALVPVPRYVTASTTELVPPEVSIDTDAQLLYSPQVQRAVGAVLDTEDDVRNRLSVTASPQSRVLHVTATADTGRLAADAADAAVAALVDVRRDALGALALDQQLQLRLRISAQERLLAKEQSRRLVLPANDDVFAQLLQLRSALVDLEDARAQPADPLGPAVAPRDADYANVEVPVISGAMLGLIGAWLLGVGRDRAGRRYDGPRRPPSSPASGDLPHAATRPKDYEHVH